MLKRFGIGLGVAAIIFASLATYGWFGTDYKNTRDLIYDLDNGEEVVGKTVMVDVRDYQYTGLVYYFKPSNRLDFISPKNPNFKEGRKEIVEITHVQPMFDRYIIGYKLEGDEDNDATYSTE
ncbi:TPA: hypothetical protein SIF56_004476 [Escherichia coli]|nr:hypothetical protein [Escherichia coli]